MCAVRCKFTNYFLLHVIFICQRPILIAITCVALSQARHCRLLC